jgi:hypothetical protein
VAEDRMTSFFFDLDLNGHFERDSIGTDLDGAESVRDEAVRALGEIAKDYLLGAHLNAIVSIIARSDGGDEIYRAELRFSETRLKVERADAV